MCIQKHSVFTSRGISTLAQSKYSFGDGDEEEEEGQKYVFIYTCDKKKKLTGDKCLR